MATALSESAQEAEPGTHTSATTCYYLLYYLVLLPTTYYTYLPVSPPTASGGADRRCKGEAGATCATCFFLPSSSIP